MQNWIKQLPFRLGTTSYILPDEILPNVNYLAGLVKDIELVLFEVDEGPSNFPSVEVIDALIGLAGEHDLTFTIHLPLDLRLGAEGRTLSVSLDKARRVIKATRPLDPWAYVLHLDAHEYRDIPSEQALDPSPELKRWQDQAVRALDIAAGWAGGPEQLAVENLEGYALDFLEPVLKRIPVSRCVDIGHLWRDGHDPFPYLEGAFLRTRVIHWHGIGARDHQSLELMPLAQVGGVMSWLLEKRYQGVVTLEIFNQADLEGSIKTIEQAIGSSIKNEG
jgi:sugar phosphate isomerase/epimerase